MASERQTAGVALAAVASVLLSATWNDTTIGADYWLRAAVVAAGGGLAVVAARRRERATRAETIGAQLTAALSNLAEAVVVQDDKHQLLYANDAAAATLGYASAEVLLTTPREQLVGDADYFAENGEPLPRTSTRRPASSAARTPGRSRSGSSSATPARSAGA